MFNEGFKQIFSAVAKRHLGPMAELKAGEVSIPHIPPSGKGNLT